MKIIVRLKLNRKNLTFCYWRRYDFIGTGPTFVFGTGHLNSVISKILNVSLPLSEEVTKKKPFDFLNQGSIEKIKKKGLISKVYTQTKAYHTNNWTR